MIYSRVSTLIDYRVDQLITSLSFNSFEVNKNTLIDYLEHLIDYIILELFPDVGKNTLVYYLDNLINYFVDLIDYRRL